MTTKYKDIDFEMVVWNICCTLVLGIQENKIIKLESIPLVVFNSVNWVRIVSDNYLLKENGIITSESYVRLTLGNYVIKLCKWDQEITY